MTIEPLAELGELGANLAQALYPEPQAGRPPQTRPGSDVNWLSRPRRLIAIGCGLAGLTGAGIAVAAVLSPAPVSFSQYHDGTTAPLAPAVPPADSTELFILRRPVTAVDALPAAFVIRHQHSALVGALGANLALARKAVGLSSGAAWVIPADQMICLAVSDDGTDSISGTACASDVSVARGREALIIGRFVAGIVPNGVSTVTITLSDGMSSTVAVHDNVYTFESSASPLTVTFTGPAGPISDRL